MIAKIKALLGHKSQPKERLLDDYPFIIQLAITQLKFRERDLGDQAELYLRQGLPTTPILEQFVEVVMKREALERRLRELETAIDKE